MSHPPRYSLALGLTLHYIASHFITSNYITSLHCINPRYSLALALFEMCVGEASDTASFRVRHAGGLKASAALLAVDASGWGVDEVQARERSIGRSTRAVIEWRRSAEGWAGASAMRRLARDTSSTPGGGAARHGMASPQRDESESLSRPRRAAARRGGRRGRRRRRVRVPAQAWLTTHEFAGWLSGPFRDASVDGAALARLDKVRAHVCFFSLSLYLSLSLLHACPVGDVLSTLAVGLKGQRGAISSVRLPPSL